MVIHESAPFRRHLGVQVDRVNTIPTQAQLGRNRDLARHRISHSTNDLANPVRVQQQRGSAIMAAFTVFAGQPKLISIPGAPNFAAVTAEAAIRPGSPPNN